MARDLIGTTLFPLLDSAKGCSPDDQSLLRQTILDLRSAEACDEIASAVLNIYAHAETRIVCENVLDALALLYSSDPGEPERFPSEQVQILYGRTLLEVVDCSRFADVRVNAIINLRVEDYDRI